MCTFYVGFSKRGWLATQSTPKSPPPPPPPPHYPLIRPWKNKKIREKFSCLAIFLSVTEVVRLLRRYASQILKCFSCSDWFSRNYHAPATHQKILLFPSGNKCHAGLHTGYHLTLLATANHVDQCLHEREEASPETM